MKQILFFTLALAYAASAHATSIVDWTIIKSWDGKIASCSADNDLNKPAYGPTKSSSLTLQGNTIRLNMNMVSLICKKSGWTSSSFTDPVPYTTASDGSTGSILVKNPQFLLVDEASKPMGTVAIGDQSSVSAAFSFDLDKILTQSDRDALNNGQDAKIRWEIFERAGIIAVNGSGDIVNKRLGHGGSFYIHFTLREDNNGNLVITKKWIQ
jgi:hypothetical protein